MGPLCGGWVVLGKHWLILSKKQHSKASKTTQNKAGITYMTMGVWRAIVSVFMLVSSVIPAGANAGVLSGIMAALSRVSEYKTEIAYNSQTIPVLSAANHTDPNPAKGGGDITIEAGSALVPSLSPTGEPLTNDSSAKPAVGHVSIYVVREGDSLSEIADLFGVSINTLLWANDIKNPKTIQPGDELVILPVTGIKYTVKTGGSVRDIVKKYGGDADEVAAYNGVGADQELAAGTEVIIPDGEMPAPKPVVKVASSVSSSSGTAVRLSAAGGPEYSGYFVKPVAGAVRTQGIHGYNAVDLAAPTGTPIVAAASGTVTISRASGYNGGYGLYVVISHSNGSQTLYAHMSENISYQGEYVQQGQVIGYVGNTGRSTGPHVHFEVRGAKNPF